MLSTLVVIAGKGFDFHDEVEALAWLWQNLGMYVSIRLEHLLHAQTVVEHESIPVTNISRKKGYVETYGYRIRSRFPTANHLWIQEGNKQ